MKNNVIIADAGNTALKLALFSKGKPEFVQRVRYDELQLWFDKNQNLAEHTCVLSSVTDVTIENQLQSFFHTLLKIDHHSNLPFKVSYQTPETLGIDRLCNAAALSVLAKGKNAVSIDIGTCLKFDFVDAKGTYHGGSISPGIQLRYKALNDYTANLPLLDLVDQTQLIGSSTQKAIHSGVINGIQAEINGFIQQYEIEQGELTFFITGGDATHFDFEGKNNIFADENLTLKGLYYIYEANVH
jgi:type III pantothenate kinase